MHDDRRIVEDRIRRFVDKRLKRCRLCGFGAPDGDRLGRTRRAVPFAEAVARTSTRSPPDAVGPRGRPCGCM
ncbi:hypothetical protein I541_5751 [Mycobacteroides abscessus]|nr:hypothetical protein I541_5751 [Mycobacteroides abscessus]